MATIKIKGHEIEALPSRDSSNRRALQFKNKIIENLGKMSIKRDDVDIPLETVTIKKAKAAATWYSKEHMMHYSCNTQKTFIENLHLVSQLLEKEINLVLSGEKTMDEFTEEFREDHDVEDKRKEAREFLGLDHDTHDLNVIDKKYKEMAKELHPDMPTGDTAKFKELNKAHKTLKRELL